MRRKEFTFLIYNFALCFFLFVLLVYFEQALSYGYSNWYMSNTKATICISLIILVLDFILLAKFKILTFKMALLTLVEFALVIWALSFFLILDQVYNNRRIIFSVVCPNTYQLLKPLCKNLTRHRSYNFPFLLSHSPFTTGIVYLFSPNFSSVF